MKKSLYGMIALTAAFLCLLLGLFIGRQNADDRVTLFHKDDRVITLDSLDDGLININTATLEELELLPGIGQVLAQRIIAYRRDNGAFRNPEDLCRVEGIGTKIFGALEEYITTGGNNEDSGS